MKKFRSASWGELPLRLYFSSKGSASATWLCLMFRKVRMRLAHRSDPAKNFLWRYDDGMTKAKIAISLPKDQLARVQRKVRSGRADSVSGYITRVLEEEERSESLKALLEDLIGEYGEPSAKDKKWAERALATRRG